MARKPMDPFARKMWLGAIIYGSMMLLMFAVLTVIYLHTHPRCSERVVGQADSPNGHWGAAIIERRCGDETPFFTHVNLRPAGADLDRGFFSGVASEGEVFVIEQDAAVGVTLKWTDGYTLLIQCSRCTASFIQKKNERWNSLLIKYDSAIR